MAKVQRFILQELAKGALIHVGNISEPHQKAGQVYWLSTTGERIRKELVQRIGR